MDYKCCWWQRNRLDDPLVAMRFQGTLDVLHTANG